MGMTTPNYRTKNGAYGDLIGVGLFGLFLGVLMIGAVIHMALTNVEQDYEVTVRGFNETQTYISEGRVHPSGESWQFREKNTGRIIYVPKALTTVVSMSRYEQALPHNH